MNRTLLAALLLASGPALADSSCVHGTTGPGSCPKPLTPRQRPYVPGDDPRAAEAAQRLVQGPADEWGQHAAKEKQKRNEVPEPSSLWLVLAGLAAALWRRR